MAAAAPLVAILDFDEDPAFYARILDGARVECLLLERTTRYAVAPVRDDPLPPQIKDVVVALVWHLVHVPRDLIDAMPALKAIVRVGAGYDSVDLAYCGERGIAVCNVPDYGTEEVADSAMGHILNLLRHTTRQLLRVRVGVWDSRSLGAQRVRGKVLGLLGFGRIGKAVARRAHPFGLEVLFYDPHRPDGEDKALGVRRAHSLRELLEQTDVLSIHCDLNPVTRHIINSTTLAWLRRGSFVVNTARGGIVDLDALVAALRSNHLAGAALDVLEAEPGALGLCEVPHLDLTPHCAFYSDPAWEEMKTKAALEARRALTGEPLRNVVNTQHLRS